MTGFPYTLADVKAPLVRALRLTAEDDIKLAVSRIDVHHKELCGLSDWGPLRKVTVQSPASGKIDLTSGCGVKGVIGNADGMPYWFAEQRDLHSGDLRGVRVWTLAPPSAADKLTIAAWRWDGVAGKHVVETTSLEISWWELPDTLDDDDDALALPSTRALLARSICDVIGLMDRKEPDATPWRRDLPSAMAELIGRIPATIPRVYRTLSGRMLAMAPAINYNTQAVATEQRDEDNN